MNQKIDKAIKQLYDVFGKYPLKDIIDTCPHCEIEDLERNLHKKPLKDLSWDDLGQYSFKAVSTFGDVEDYKHFLPRLCELLAVDYDNNPNFLFIFISKFEYCKLDSWPEDEQRTIKYFLKVWSKSLGGWKREEAEKAMKEYKITI